MTALRFSLALLALGLASPGVAQPLPAAIAGGSVGERFDGYMGFAVPPTPEVRRQVNAINIKRRILYIQLAAGKNTTADQVGMLTACELFSRLPTGQSYQLSDGVWRRLGAGEPRPQPDYCR